MNLLPKCSEEFNRKEYWNSFFEKRGGKAFEWYGEYPQLCGYIHKYVKQKEEILVVGCGNSLLGSNMYDAGFVNITSIDISKIAIRQMSTKNSKRTGMKFLQMDALKMTFEDEYFGAVVDKGTLDALMINDSPETQEQVRSYFKEITRVLKNGGRYLCISLLQEPILNAILQYFCGNSFMFRLVRCYEVEKAANDSDEDTMPTFLIICTKFRGLPSKILEIDFSLANKITRCKDESEVRDIVQNAQQTFFMSWGLKRLRLNGDETVTFDVFAVDENVARYTVHVVDKEIVRGHTPYSAFVVPQGRESEWLFSTPDGRRQLARLCKCNRLAVITLHRNQAYESLNSVKLEMSECVQNMAPGNMKNAKIQFLSLGEDVGKRELVCQGKSEFSGEYIIEDVECNEHVFRRLYYLNSQLVIQSEVKLKDSTSQKNTEFDFTYLTCTHHIYISRGLHMALPKNYDGSAVIIGLGGGGLCSFLKRFIPKMKITAVDIDVEMLNVATTWFGLDITDKLNVEIMDGIEFLKKSQKLELQYDAIVFDVDSKDSTIGMSCPPPEFLTKKVLEYVVSCLKTHGYFILNLVLRETNLRSKIVVDLKQHFTSVFSFDLQEDLNEIFYCTNNTVDKNEIINDFNVSSSSINTFFKGCLHKELVDEDISFFKCC